MTKEKILETLEKIAQDMEDDAGKFDGQPFNGRTVGTYFGYQGAAIAALSEIVKSLIESQIRIKRTDTLDYAPEPSTEG